MKKYCLFGVMTVMVLILWGIAGGQPQYASNCDTSISCASCHSDGRTCSTYVTPTPSPSPDPTPTPSPSVGYASFSSDGILNIPACYVIDDFWSISLEITSLDQLFFTVIDAAPVYDYPTSTYATFGYDGILYIPELDLAGETWSCALQLMWVDPDIVFQVINAAPAYSYYQ